MPPPHPNISVTHLELSSQEDVPTPLLPAAAAPALLPGPPVPQDQYRVKLMESGQTGQNGP